MPSTGSNQTASSYSDGGQGQLVSLRQNRPDLGTIDLIAACPDGRNAVANLYMRSNVAMGIESQGFRPRF